MAIHDIPSEAIEQLLLTESEFYTPASLVAHARLNDYAAEYRRSVEDTEGFWAGIAQELEWFQPWRKVFDWKYPIFEWFQSAKCNISYTCLDRQVKADAGTRSRTSGPRRTAPSGKSPTDNCWTSYHVPQTGCARWA